MLVLDTNVLLLWLVARSDPSLVLSYKRVAMFTYEDVKLIRMLVADFVHLRSTPHVLAEVSNFLDQAPPHRRDALTTAFQSYIEGTDEVFEPSISLCKAAGLF